MSLTRFWRSTSSAAASRPADPPIGGPGHADAALALSAPFPVLTPKAPDEAGAEGAISHRFAPAASGRASGGPVHGIGRRPPEEESSVLTLPPLRGSAPDGAPASAGDGQSALRASPERVELSDDTMLLLRLVALHEGYDPATMLDRLVAEKARAIGVPALFSAAADDTEILREGGPVRLAPGSSHGSRPVLADPAALFEDGTTVGVQPAARHDSSGEGDLAEVPAFDRRAASRFSTQEDISHA